MSSIIEDQEGGGPALDEASDRGLFRIDKMAQASEELDELGEQLSELSLAEVERATTTVRLVLLAVIFELLLVGAGLCDGARGQRVAQALCRAAGSYREAGGENSPIS